MKIANITPTHEKDEPAGDCIAFIIRIFERLLYNQLIEYLEKSLNILLCGFQKVNSTQHAFSILLQTWQEELGKSSFVDGILMDLSKTYDYFLHDLLVAKCEAYGIDKTGLNLIQIYLSNR